MAGVIATSALGVLNVVVYTLIVVLKRRKHYVVREKGTDGQPGWCSSRYLRRRNAEKVRRYNEDLAREFGRADLTYTVERL
jgi:hypothetical protein